MPKKYKVIALIVLVFVIISGIGYVFRGWVRNSVVPGYVSIFYKGDVNTAFKQSFPNINKELEDYGISFDNHMYSHDTSCGASFEGFSESVVCNKKIHSDQSTFPSSFNDYWTKNSPRLEKQLLGNGWKDDSHQPIDSLLRGNEATYYNSLGTTYIKYYGKTHCTLMFSAFGSKPAQLTVSEYCERNVAFFHGQLN